MAKDFARAFYASNEWKLKRKEILRRDLYTCNRCGGRAAVIHHVVELTPQNISDPRIALGSENLESLCHDCHTKETIGCSDLPSGFYFDESGQVTPRGG